MWLQAFIPPGQSYTWFHLFNQFNFVCNQVSSVAPFWLEWKPAATPALFADKIEDISVQTLCYQPRYWALVHPNSSNRPWEASTASLEITWACLSCLVVIRKGHAFLHKLRKVGVLVKAGLCQEIILHPSFSNGRNLEQSWAFWDPAKLSNQSWRALVRQVTKNLIIIVNEILPLWKPCRRTSTGPALHKSGLCGQATFKLKTFLTIWHIWEHFETWNTSRDKIYLYKLLPQFLAAGMKETHGDAVEMCFSYMEWNMNEMKWSGWRELKSSS